MHYLGKQASHISYVLAHHHYPHKEEGQDKVTIEMSP